MSLTTLIFIAIYGIGILLTLRNPFYGIALYIFEWHNHPPYWWWGSDLPDVRWSFLIVLLIVISLVINRNKLPQLKGIDYKPFIWLVLLLVNVYFVDLFFAVHARASATKVQDWSKLIIYYFLIVYVIRSPKDYRLIIWIILLCVGNFGRVAFEEGSHRDLGISAPGATGGNPIAAHVMTTLPFLGMVFLSGNKWEKIGTVLIAPFALNLIILENSRSAFVGILAIGFLAVLWVRGKTRLKVVSAMALGAILFLNLTNQQFWDRMGTIFGFTGETEGRVVEEKPDNRIFLWRGAVEMIGDYPTGTGGSGFNYLMVNYVPELASRYAGKEETGRTVHNTILNVATEWGIQGLIFYLGFLIHSFIVMMKTKKYSQFTRNPKFYYLNGVALQLGLIGNMVAGLTHNHQYMEIVIWICALALVLRNIQKNEIAELMGTAPQSISETPEPLTISEKPQTV